MDLPQPPFGMPTPPVGNNDADAQRNAALDKVKVPAIFLIVVWSLSLLSHFVGLLMRIIGHGAQGQQMEVIMDGLRKANPDIERQLPFLRSLFDSMQAMGVVLTILAIVLCVVGLIAAIKMLQLRTFGLVMAGAILAVIPCNTTCCCLLGMPIGIWALVVVNSRTVRNQFR